jgi:hypothetical protein
MPPMSDGFSDMGLTWTHCGYVLILFAIVATPILIVIRVVAWLIWRRRDLTTRER